jgi:8-oxo-dGTP diphosphatase
MNLLPIQGEKKAVAVDFLREPAPRFQRYTLLVGYDRTPPEDRILLGFKRRGFGQGKWNGFGGKVEDGEQIREAALRELYEEAGVYCVGDGHQASSRCTLQPSQGQSFRWAGRLFFSFEEETFPNMIVDLFSGMICACRQPRASEEMEPHWFPCSQIPYELMWPDDAVWLPRLIEQDRARTPSVLEAHFHYDAAAEKIHSERVQLISPERVNAAKADDLLWTT